MSARVDPIRSFRYEVRIDGISMAGFSEVLIPDTSVDTIEYREGNEIAVMRKLPGMIRYPHIILKKGLTSGMDLYNWYMQIVQGKIKDARKTVSIIVHDETGAEASKFSFTNAWPSRYESPNLNAMSNEIAIESLQINHEGMIREK